MRKLWVSYAWADNKDGDVDFVCQEIRKRGVDVRIDRTTLEAGRRLWPQIEKFITDPAESDAWAFYATSTSISREACKEEIAIALDRALQNRGPTYPLIGITPSSADVPLFPSAVRTRLCVSLEDSDWIERVCATIEGRQPHIRLAEILPYNIQIHRKWGKTIFEMRPRVGTWHPFAAGVPAAEKASVNPLLMHGPSGTPPSVSLTSTKRERLSPDGKWIVVSSGNQASPTMSFYLCCSGVPSSIFFGAGAGPYFVISVAEGDGVHPWVEIGKE